MTDGNDLAHPEMSYSYKDRDGDLSHVSSGGLTKRELFAAMAMQGMLANSGGPIQANGVNGWSLTNCDGETVASFATDMADNLIAALNKDKE